MARPKLGDSESKRLQMVITEEELLAIDDWRFENRIASRSDAIRRLVQIGLRFDRLFQALYDETSDLVDLAPQISDKIARDLDELEATGNKVGFDTRMGLTVLMALENQSYGQRRLLNLLLGVLGETATLKGEGATANAIQRTDSAAEAYYATIKEVLKPLVAKWRKAENK